MKKILLLLALASILCPGFLGAEGIDVSKKPVEVSIYGLSTQSGSGPGFEAMAETLRRFNKRYPWIHLKSFHMPAVKGMSMDTGVLMGIASGNPPHSIYVNFRASSSYINHGFLTPLEELLARLHSANVQTRMVDESGEWLASPSEAEIAEWTEKIRERVSPVVWPVIYREASAQKEGIPKGEHVWAIPERTSIGVLIYRKDLFKRAGLDPNRPPKNWEELLDYSRRLKTLPKVYGMMIQGGPVISWGAYSLLVSNGVRYMEKNEDGEWEARFDTRAAAEAIYFLARMVNEPFTVDGRTYHGTAYVPVGTAANLWDQGLIGMRFSSLGEDVLASLNPELVGIAPIPTSHRGGRGGEVNAAMYGVFRGSSPAQQLAVARYLWHITSEEAKEIQTRSYVEHGFGQFLNPALLEKFGYDDVLRKVPKEWRQILKTALESGVPEPYGRNTQFIYNKVSEPINWALQNPILEFSEEEALQRIEEQLSIQADRVNKHLLGKLSDEEWRSRRLVGALLLLLLVVVFSVSLFWVWRSFTKEELDLHVDRRFRRFTKAYLLLLPSLLIVLLWQYLPVILGMPLALLDYELVISSEFVGIDNFAMILYDPRFWSSLVKTFYYALLVVGLGFWPPILVAVLLDEVPSASLKYFFRTIFFLPTIVSGIILVFLWRQFYEPSESGVLNQLLLTLNEFGPVGGTLVRWLLLGFWLSLLGLLFAAVFKLKELSVPVRSAVFLFALALLGATLWPLVAGYQGPSQMEIDARGLDPAKVSGWSGVVLVLKNLVGSFQLEPLGWIEDPAMAMLCCVIPGIWATAGPGCIIYLAALKTVPHELVEAASVDGASILQKLCYITLPRIKFLILIQLVGAVVAAFKGGTNFILAMTGGGPNGATRVLGMDIFERSFMELKYGQGAAMAWVLGGMVIVITAYQLKRLSRAEFKSAAATEK